MEHASPGGPRQQLPPLQYTPSEQGILDSYRGASVHRAGKVNSAVSLPSMQETPTRDDCDTPSPPHENTTASRDTAPFAASNRVLPVGGMPTPPPAVDHATPCPLAATESVGRALLRRVVAFVFLQACHENIDIYHDATLSFAWMIHPNSNFRKIWDTTIAFMVLYVCYVTPVYLAFDFLKWDLLSPVETFLNVCFVADMILSFRTGVFASGEVRMDARFVAQHYLRSWFLIDLISNIPFDKVFSDSSMNKQNSTMKFVKLEKLPKLLRFGILLKYLRQYAKYYNLLLTSSAMVLCLHCLTCFWVYVFNECDTIGCPPDEAFELYTQSFYNVLLLFLGIGEGSSFQASPYLSSPSVTVKPSMYGLCIAIAIMGAMMCSFMFGNILTLMMSWDQQSSSFRNRMDVISSEMKHYNLPGELQHRVKRNYDYLWINQRAYADMTLLNQPGLSKPLRTTIALHLYKDLLNTVPIFAGSDSKFLGKVCMALDTAVYLPGDIIIHKDDIGREMFIVRKGQVEVLTAESPTPQSTYRRMSLSSKHLSTVPNSRIILHDGDFFGETALVAEVRRTNTVVAITICDLNVLSKHAFNEILAEYPEFGTKMQQSVVTRQLANMNIRSPTTKKKVENQLNHLVQKSMMRRRLSNTWKGVYKAKKMADKLKSIQERAKKTDETGTGGDGTARRSTRTTFIANFLSKVPSKRGLLEMLPRSSGGNLLTSRSMRRESNKKSLESKNDDVVGDDDGADETAAAMDADNAVPNEVAIAPRKRKMAAAAGDLVSRRLNAAEIQAKFVPFALLEINTMVLDIKEALEKVQRKLAVTNVDSDSDDDAVPALKSDELNEPKMANYDLAYATTDDEALLKGDMTPEDAAALERLAKMQKDQDQLLVSTANHPPVESPSSAASILDSQLPSDVKEPAPPPKPHSKKRKSRKTER
ncbi:hypothetical protein, variant [Aphanomyces invadans]|uniref:Cyclic nucleotide-binding domain-containing protein n=1 Tax=Aphanomyces invadans TaxID=157072 RepID=A0A024UWW3_9STRA|nr:hypothetical protein, variant [Aphanomyces invadans]ETW10407.1 hypothetical protein, variant [Aphanomyces invadans]|eukprot:XP_008861818.1 hypothetical protein, variant [Aphanomyces invadans]